MTRVHDPKYLFELGHDQAAAILGRVILEDALKRLARLEQLDDTKKATVLNDELKKARRYNQIQWRQIQVWVDIGNDAAHKNPPTYKKRRSQRSNRWYRTLYCK